VQAFPNSKPVSEAAAVPLAILINPSQVTGVPMLDYTSSPLVRCTRCYSYLSPFTQIVTPTSWRCPFCGLVNDNPQIAEPLSQKVELSSPVYDMLAPPSFNTPYAISPSFLFLLDLSVPAVSSGFTLQCLSSLRASLTSLSDDTRIGLMTMSNSITFYDLHKHSSFITTDLSDPFLPSSQLETLSACREELDGLIQSLVDRSGEAASNGHCLGSALSVAGRILSSGGIVIACCAGLPTVGPFAIRAPDEKGVDHSLQQYRELAGILNRSGVSVSLFVSGSASPSGLYSISQPAVATGGLAHFYPEFDANSLHVALFETVTASYVRAVQLRLRCTTGIATSQLFGNVGIRDATIRSPVLSAHAGLAFELRVESDIKNALFQTAILFSDEGSRRFIRVMTFGLPVTNQPATVRAAVDEGALAVFLLKRAAGLLPLHPVDEVLAGLQRVFAVLTSTAKFSSLYHLVHGLLGSRLLRASVAQDARIRELVHLRAVSIVPGLLYQYPRLFAVDAGRHVLPLGADAFTRGYVLLVHAWDRIYVWVNQETPRELVAAFFGGQEVTPEVPRLQTELNQRLNEIIAECYALSGRYLPVEVIPPGDERVVVFGELLADASLASGADLAGFLSSVYH
jgi:protein transport protein SEC24